MATSKRSKIQQAKDIPIGGTTFGEILGAVLKVKPKATKKVAPKKKAKKR